MLCRPVPGDAVVAVGRIARSHGLRGEVLVDVRTDEPESRFAPGAVLQTSPAAAGPLTVASTRRYTSGGGRRLIVAFTGVTSRERADELRGTLLQVPVASLPAPEDPDEFRDHQLIGLAAVDRAGAVLGEVVDVDHNSASDLLILQRPDGRRAMIPFVRAIVPDVDLAARRLVLDPSPGLLEL